MREANENKEAFVAAFVAALVEHGGGRYDDLADVPVNYLVSDDGEEWLWRHSRLYCRVTGNSLPSLAEAIVKRML